MDASDASVYWPQNIYETSLIELSSLLPDLHNIRQLF